MENFRFFAENVLHDIMSSVIGMIGTFAIRKITNNFYHLLTTAFDLSDSFVRFHNALFTFFSLFSCQVRLGKFDFSDFSFPFSQLEIYSIPISCTEIVFFSPFSFFHFSALFFFSSTNFPRLFSYRDTFENFSQFSLILIMTALADTSSFNQNAQ